MSAEDKLCRIMGYSNAVLFSRARDALKAWCELNSTKIKIPTNCCAALLPFAKELVPINPETGLAPVPVQLYGFRQEFPGACLEIDPLMTGAFGQPFADSTIISFGYSKTIDIGAGGAILTDDKTHAVHYRWRGYFPDVLRAPLQAALDNFHAIVMEKKKQYEEIEATYGWLVKKFPERPIVPWRFTGRIMTVENGKAIYKSAPDLRIGRNYPPLPGVTNPGAIQFGVDVVNIWR